MQAGLGSIFKLSNESAEMEPDLQKAWHGVRDTVNLSQQSSQTPRGDAMVLESKLNVQEWVHHNFTFYLWLMTVHVTPSSENILKCIILLIFLCLSHDWVPMSRFTEQSAEWDNWEDQNENPETQRWTRHGLPLLKYLSCKGLREWNKWPNVNFLNSKVLYKMEVFFHLISSFLPFLRQGIVT